MEAVKYIVELVISLSVATYVLVYIFDVPTKLTGARALATEYYYQNFTTSFILDIFLVGIYLSIGTAVADMLRVRREAARFACVISTSGCISSLFFLLFTSGWRKGSFFHRWFSTVGIMAILCDMILVGGVYGCRLFLKKIIASRLSRKS